MSNQNDIKIEKGKKARKMSKKKWIFSGIILFGVLLSTALILAFNLKKSPNNPNNGSTTKLTDVSDASDFTYIKKANTTYNISSSDYAVITGLSQTGIAKIQMNSGSSYRLVFPSAVLETDPTTGNFIEIPVCEINTTIDSTGNTLKGPNGFSYSAFSYSKTNNGRNQVGNNSSATNVVDGATYPDWISEVVVPESVQYIAEGSFHGLDHLEKITLPFVGTERGNTAAGSGVGSTDGYKSAFGAIFGHNNRIMGNFVANNDYFPITDARHPSFTDGQNKIIEDIDNQLGLTNSNGTYVNKCYYEWYNDIVTINSPTYINMPYNLREIEITDEISIANHAFFNLFDVKNIKVGFKKTSSSLTDAGIIGEYAFAKCVNLETAELPESLSEMGGVSSLKIGTFNECYKLKNVTLPKNLKEISEAMFTSCRVLTSLEIPNTVEKIGAKAFDGCRSLSSLYPSNGSEEAKTLRLPETVKEIGSQAFRACYGFETVVVPNLTKSIGQYAFDSCINIKAMTLPFIGKEAGTTGTEEALFGWIFGRTTDSTSANTGVLSVKQNVTGNQNDSNQQNIFTYYIPKNLTSLLILNETVVAPGSLMNLSNLTTLAIQYPSTSDAQMTIAEGALSGCGKLQSLTLPFLGEYDYTSREVKPEYAQLGWAFGKESYNGSYGIAAVTSDSSSFDWQVPISLNSVHLEHQTILPSYGFYNATNITEVVIGKNTISSDSAVFYNMSALAKLELPFIGYQRGEKCREHYFEFGPTSSWHCSLSYFFGASTTNGFYLNNVNWYYQILIPESLKEVKITDDTYIYTPSFQGFKSLEKISIQTGENEITGIAGGIFYRCSNLKTLELPFIGAARNSEKYNSVSLTMHYLFGESDYESTYMVKNIFNNGRTYYFPKSLDSITIEDGINCIPAYAFAGMMSLTSITTDAYIDSISTSAFEGCFNLSILKMDNARYTDVADRAFVSCYSLGNTDKFLPATVRTIGNYALSGTSIDGIDSRIKDKITSLGAGALSNCQNISSFDFSEYRSLNFVGSYLFSGCKNLSQVNLTDYLTPYMFQNCISLENIDISGVLQKQASLQGSVEISDGLFDGCASLKSPIANSTTTGVYFGTGANIDAIGAYAFRGCVSLTNLDLPTTLQEIREGAFQNCIKLEMLRIPRDCYIMPEGTDRTKNEDQLDTGIFYGCNPDFYLEVYLDENDWPTTWGFNWNCYFPVHVIGGSTADIFTFEYNNDLRGYIITGLNFDKYTFVDRSTGNIRYLLSDTLTFPSTYMGLPVYGIKDNAFSGNDTDPNGHNAQDALSQVNKFILGSDFKTIGQSALSFNYVDESTGIDNGTQRIVYIFSQRTLANSQSYNELHVDQENVYSASAMIFYKDVWKYVGTRPVILLSALTFHLENDSYQYAFGAHIVPVIDEITAQPNGATSGQSAIKYTNEDFKNVGGDYIYDIFYEEDVNGDPVLNLSNINVQYANNVNVGTASIIINSNTPDLYGSKTIYFKINPIELDLFTESDNSDFLFKDYGTTTSGMPFKNAYEVFAELYDIYYKKNGNKITDDLINNNPFLKTFFTRYTNMTYGSQWEFSNWTTGGGALNLPENYKMTGTLTTSSNNRGIYMSWKESTPFGVDNIWSVADFNNLYGASAGGFTWKVAPHVYDENGKDVTGNFTFMITNCVVINPYELKSDGIDWDGTLNGNIWEYPYTGLSVVPKPSIKNSRIDLAGQCTVEVRVPGSTSVTTAIDPFTITNSTYHAVITSVSDNFELGSSTVFMEFKIVPSNVRIDINVTHTILETEDFYRFSGPFVTSTSDNYDIRITGLGNSTITGDLETSGYQKGTYSNNDNSLIFNFGINGGSPFKITSNSRTGVGTSLLDETKDGIYYNVTYNMRCTILWQEFDARLYLTDRDGKGNDIVYEANKQNVYPKYSLVESSLEENQALTNGMAIDLTYGTDGYEHPLTVKVLNSKATDLGKFEDLTNQNITTGKYIIKDTGSYQVEVTLEKEKYETMTFRVRIYVEKGNYIFDNLSKEYDREPVNVFDAFARKPADFNESKIKYQFYNASTNEAINPPTNVGNYYVIIETDQNHSDYFNDLPSPIVDNKIQFTISPRSITIDVEDPTNEKVYDGLPWIYVANNDTKTSLNLLPGDTLTGEFQSRSNKVGTYDGYVKGDFFNVAGFKVTNPTFAGNEQDQTSNYKITYRGQFTIKPKTMKYSSSGGVYEYDGRHHTITVTVIEPTDNYHIYYALERNIDSDDNDLTEWTPYAYYFVEPNSGSDTYLVYFKIEADTYETVYGQEQIIITGRTVKYQLGTVDFTYDGFYHTPEVIPTDPKFASVQYAVVASTSNVKFDELPWADTPDPQKDVGTYSYAFKIEAPNYTSAYGTFTMTIKDDGLSLDNLFTLTGESVDYDTLYHGVILNGIDPSINLSNLYFSYAINDASYDKDTSVFTDFGFTVDSNNAGQYYNKGYRNAGTYNLVIRVLARGYRPHYQNVTIEIRPLHLYLNATFYDNKYDGDDHTAMLSLSSTAPSTDNLIITGTIADRDLSYEYQTVINGEIHYIRLTVRYGVIPNTGSIVTKPSMDETMQVYRNVCSYMMFIEAEAENFELFEDNGNFVIRQNSLYVEVNEPVSIQYLARQVDPADFLERTEVNMATGNEETIYSIQTYFDDTKNKLVAHDGELLMKFQEYTMQNGQKVLNPSFINNPINIGHYKATYRFTGTLNCSATEWKEFDFEIVPRVLKVEYEDELEYNGNPQVPLPTITTGTSDVVDYITEMVDPQNPNIIPDVPTIPGSYTFRLKERTVNQNYILSTPYAGNLNYKIINRKVYVDYDDEEEYTSNFVTIGASYTGTNYNSGSQKFTVRNLLPYDTLDFSLTSESFFRSTYLFQDAVFQYDNLGQTYLKTSDKTDPRYYQFNPVTVTIKDTKNNDSIYYDVYFNVKMLIKRPNLEVEYDPIQTVTFDGLQHGINFNITSPGYTSGSFTYWIDGDTNISNTMITERNVGSYDICFKIETYDYEPYEGKITLVITRATLNTILDPYAGVYDGNDQTTTYQILNNPMQLLSIEEPELFYIRKEYVDNLGQTMGDLTTFFQNNTPSDNTLYDLYLVRENVMHNAGDYYAILYFPQYGPNVAVNIEGVLQIEQIRIEYRTLWFKTTLNSPIIKWKTYDSLKYGDGNLLLTLADFIYDTNPSCPNFLPDNGLVTGDSIVGGNTNLANYLIRTVSPNARGNADGENNGDPYQFEGDFEFRYIDIVNQLGQEMAANYRPAFEQMNYNGVDEYPLQVTIKRAALTIFEVSNAVKEYTGGELYPTIITPTDGSYDAFYYVTDDQYNMGANPTKLTGAPVDVGYYIVYVHANQGTNYYEWKYPTNPQQNDYLDPATGIAYRFACLQITPRTVEVYWGDEWESNNYTTTFDGHEHGANPTIELASGARQTLNYKVLDVRTNETQVQNVINAGYYYFQAQPNGVNFSGNGNYNLVNSTVLITILKRSLTVYEETNEPWLKSKWYKDYTEDDFEEWPKSDPADPTLALYNYSLKLHIETISDQSGTYKNASDFKVVAVVTDKNVIPSVTQYTGVDSSTTMVNDPRKINIFDGGTFDVADNFEFNLNMLITLDNKDLRVNKSDVDVLYSASDIYPDLKITSYNRGYTVYYATSYIEEDPVSGVQRYYQYDNTTGEVVRDSQNLPVTFDEASINYNLNSMPSFRNVGFYKVYYLVTVPGDDGVTNRYTGSTTVRIRQRDSYLSINKIDKTYDGLSISLANIGVRGGYNGSLSDLEFWFMEEGSSTGYSDTFYPVHAGTYLLKIVNKADNNDNYHQNYTPIETTGNIFRFTISPATLILTVTDDITITQDPQNLTYSSHVDNISTASNGTGSSSEGTLKSSYDLLVSGTSIPMFGNDTLSATIMTLTGRKLQRGKYNYTNGVPFVTSNENFYNSPAMFNITWDTYYNYNGSKTKSHDYDLKLIYSLNVHYPYIEGDNIDVEADYTGQPISLMSLNPLTVTYPTANLNVNLTYKFGDTSTSLTSIGDYEQTKPGKYLVYFSVEAPYYESWQGSITFTIKAVSRDGLLEEVNSIDKSYDAVVYDGKNVGVPNIQWIDPTGKDPLPAQSSWLVQYFKATSSSGRAAGTQGWIKDSDALSSVVSADDYIYRVTIPASGIYSETVIEKYFKISRKEYTISISDETIRYNGGTWICNLFDGSHVVTTTGLNQGHDLKAATIISNSSNVGEYTQQNGKLDISAAYRYIIQDQNQKDVTNNYEYRINFKLTIVNGDITLRSNIPSSGQYIYTGQRISPIVYSIEPSTLPEGCVIEYSLDGQNWSSDPTTIGQINVDKYTFKARLKNVPNYNDKEEDFSFEIVRQQRSITIGDLSKEYDGTACDWPTIVTQGFNGVVSDSNTRGITIEWYEDGKATKLPSRPVNVGKYNVKVKYPTEGDYAGTEVIAEFEITPCVLTLNVPTQTLTYNAKEQAPDIKIYCKSNNKFNVQNLLAGKYSVSYYLQSDMNFTNGQQAPFKNVGDYQIRYTITDPEASKNFVFDLTNSDTCVVPYKINKAIVNISYTGTVQYTSSKITLGSTDLTVTGLPAGAILASSIYLKKQVEGQYLARGAYDCKDFTDQFEWSTMVNNVNKPVITYNNNNEDIDNNYTVTVELDVTISGSKLPYNVIPYDGVYDGIAHSFTFKVNNSDPSTIIEYSIDGSTYSTSLPMFVDVTTGPQHIFVRVTSSLYNNGDPIYLGTDPQASDYNRFTVNITKAKIGIAYDQIDNLDKVYDDKDINLPNVTFISSNGEDLSQYLQYTFYQQDYTSIGGTIYNLVDRVDVRNVGSYYLDIKVVGAPNYEDTTDSELVHLYFKITPRKVVISLKNDSKVYDSLPWQSRVSNIPADNDGAIIQGVSGITESGLVVGHDLKGVVQTIRANAGRYSVSSDFVWENGVEITKSENGIVKNINLDNYDIIFDFDVLISKAIFDITFEDVYGTYDGRTLYYISHKWNTYPLVSLPNNSTNALDYYESMIEYNDISFASNTWQQTPIGRLVGTTTIYVKVHDPDGNYEDYLTTAQIIVQPLEASFNIGSLGVLASDKIYNGEPYEESTIKVSSSIPNDTRTVKFKYYERLADGSRGTLLQGPPTNAGNYILTMYLEADPNNGLSAVENDVPFNVIPAKIPVYWGANYVDTTTNPNKYIYKMNYTGSVVHPEAQAYGVVNVGAGTPNDPWYELIPLDVTVMAGYDGTNKGKHLCEATIHKDNTNLFYINYELINPTLEYEITDGLPSNPGNNNNGIYFPPGPDNGNGSGPNPNPGSNGTGGNAQTPGTTPSENTNSMFMGIEFRVDQYNPLAAQANTPFKYLNDEIVIEVIYHYSDPKDDKTFIFHLDQTTWKIIEIRDDTNNNIIDSNPQLNFEFQFPDPLTTPTFDVVAHLTDTNTCWNTQGDKQDKTITVHLEPKTLDPNNPGGTDYIWLETPLNNSLLASTATPRVPVVFAGNDPTKPNEYIRVWQDVQATPNNPNDDIEILLSNYTIYYGNNTNPTPSNAISPDDYAYFIVKSNQGGLYSFEFGDYSLYEAEVNAHSGDPTWINENAAPNVAQNAAFTFVIVSPEPTVIELLDDAKNTAPVPKFVQYHQDFSAGYALTYTYGILNGDRERDLSQISSVTARRESEYKLSHIPERQNLDYVLSNVKNKREFLALYAEDGTVLWDGAGIDAGTLNPSSTAVADYIGSGMFLVLYDNSTASRKPIDSVEIVVAGDTTGDGVIAASDSAVILNNALSGYVAGNDAPYKTAKYLAGLLSVSSIQSAACSALILNAALEYGKSDVIEQNFYSQYQS